MNARISLLLLGLASLPLAAQTTPAPAGSALSAGLDALQTNQPGQALADFQQVLLESPNNATANLLAATAAIELCQGAQAVQYAEKARQLDPGSWKIHTTLVAAYTEAGMKEQRDRERTLLRQLHARGEADARKATGFLLEVFPANPGSDDRVDAVEEFEPMGKFHTWYRFIVRQGDGRRIEEIDIQSNDFDQKSWAAAHPPEAAAGERQFQIVGHTESAGRGETDYRMFSGKADYDAIRAMVVRILAERPPAELK
jgi:tetratricopeptide (TPR) repeat protein